MVGIIKNLFGGKDKYYAELSEDQEPAASESQQTQPSQPAPAKATQVEEEANPKAPQKEAPTQSEPAQGIAPAPVQTSNKESKNPLAGDTFAPNYLIPKPTTPRRRPGVNMGQFIDMARDMPTPRNQ